MVVINNNFGLKNNGTASELEKKKFHRIIESSFNLLLEDYLAFFYAAKHENIKKGL